MRAHRAARVARAAATRRRARSASSTATPALSTCVRPTVCASVRPIGPRARRAIATAMCAPWIAATPLASVSLRPTPQAGILATIGCFARAPIPATGRVSANTPEILVPGRNAIAAMRLPTIASTRLERRARTTGCRAPLTLATGPDSASTRVCRRACVRAATRFSVDPRSKASSASEREQRRMAWYAATKPCCPRIAWSPAMPSPSSFSSSGAELTSGGAAPRLPHCSCVWGDSI